MERRRFTREFKLEAVRLIKDRGVSYAQASEDLKVHPSQLRDWVKKLSDDPQHAFPGHVARLEVGPNQNVGSAGDFRGTFHFLFRHVRQQCRVQLELAIDADVRALFLNYLQRAEHPVDLFVLRAAGS